MNETKVQWHPGFVAAMNLELSQNLKDLTFLQEYNLNTKPLEIDLLVIKKEAGVHISNAIGGFFRGHNIMEYKSPEDHLDIDVFYKSGAYAGLYKSYGKTLDEVKADDITVSILRAVKPRGLFRYFKEHGYTVSEPYKGICYIEDHVLFPTQIVVTDELDKNEHKWIRFLSDKLEKPQIQELVENIGRLSGKRDKELADSVLRVSIGANKRAFEEAKGDERMYEALMEFMIPDLELKEKEWERAGQQRGLEQGLEKGIQGTVAVLRRFGHDNSEIKATIVEQFGLTPDKAEKFL